LNNDKSFYSFIHSATSDHGLYNIPSVPTWPTTKCF